jgi:hypothetical protein
MRRVSLSRSIVIAALLAVVALLANPAMIVVAAGARTELPRSPLLVSQPADWSLLAVNGPHNRSSFAFAWGTPSHVAPFGLLFGGRRGSTTLADTWTFRSDTWRHLPLKVHPPPLRFADLAWDAADNEFVLFGGSNSTSYVNETWVFHAGSWSELHPSISPSARRSGGMTYDATDGYVLLWGGHNGSSPMNQTTYRTLNDSWTFHAGVWRNVTSTVAPPPVSEPSLVYDPTLGGVIEFGGYEQHGARGYLAVNQTWEYHAGRWTNLDLSHSPWARDGAAAAYDPNQKGIVLFGGQDEGVTGHCLLNDTWTLTGNSAYSMVWTQLYPVSSPPLMDSAAAIYDAHDQQVVLFGGTGTPTTVCAKAQVWFGSTWVFTP